MTYDEKEYFEERAAIAEYDGNMNRLDAEDLALELLRMMKDNKDES